MLVALIPTAVLASVDTGADSVQSIGVCFDFHTCPTFCSVYANSMCMYANL